MLNPQRTSTFLSEAGDDAFRNSLLQPQWISNIINALASADGPRKHSEKVKALTCNLEHCCVTFLVVVFEHRLIRSPRSSAYVRCGHATASFDDVGISDYETIC